MCSCTSWFHQSGESSVKGSPRLLPQLSFEKHHMLRGTAQLTRLLETGWLLPKSPPVTVGCLGMVILWPQFLYVQNKAMVPMSWGIGRIRWVNVECLMATTMATVYLLSRKCLSNGAIYIHGCYYCYLTHLASSIALWYSCCGNHSPPFLPPGRKPFVSRCFPILCCPHAEL